MKANEHTFKIDIPDDVAKLILKKDSDVNLITHIIGKTGGVEEGLVNKTFNIESEKTKGIYAFWWISEVKYNFNCEVEYFGPNKKPKRQIEKFIWKNSTNEELNYQCLYVGRTTNFRNRISMHLMLDTPEWYNNNLPEKANRVWSKSKRQILKRNTQCQFRAGFEHLFKNEKQNNLEILKKSVAITFVPIDDFEERFYSEDFAIGYFRPWFNLDSER